MLLNICSIVTSNDKQVDAFKYMQHSNIQIIKLFHSKTILNDEFRLSPFRVCSVLAYTCCLI